MQISHLEQILSASNKKYGGTDKRLTRQKKPSNIIVNEEEEVKEEELKTIKIKTAKKRMQHDKSIIDSNRDILQTQTDAKLNEMCAFAY